jgi:hypothetical protein
MESYKQNGAYGAWARDLGNAETELSNNGIKSTVLSSSMGMVGWVLAQSVGEQNA